MFERQHRLLLGDAGRRFNFHIDDHFEWIQDGRWYAIVKDHDAPFLTPMPFRGRPNAPYLVPLTVRALAAVKDLELAQLCEVLADNGRRSFALP